MNETEMEQWMEDTTRSLKLSPVMAINQWSSNASLIADCARLGYLQEHWLTLDPTYGHGTFWKEWQPSRLIISDINPSTEGPYVRRDDFTALPWADRLFDSIVFDPPYKLNGTPDPSIDARYGVHVSTDWRVRMELIRSGISECARVLKDGYFLLKCQDQVCSGKVRWQTYEFTRHAEECGLGLVDRLDFLSYRAQPTGTRQIHARRNSSTMLVFKRGWESTP